MNDVVNQKKKKTGFSATDSVVDKIIRGTASFLSIRRKPDPMCSDDPDRHDNVKIIGNFPSTPLIPHFRALFSILDVVCFMLLPASAAATFSSSLI